MPRLHSLLLTLLIVGTCANKKMDRLSEAEHQHYDALRVWMDAKEIKAWLKLKTEEERNQWLKDHQLWDRFYQYDPNVRQAIVDGLVAIGWKQDMVFMAWGPPHEQLRNPTKQIAGRSEIFVYLFELTEGGDLLVWQPGSKETHHAVDRYRIELTVDNGAVTEMEQKKGWD